MAEKEKIISIIFDAIDEVNQDYPKEEQLKKSSDTPLAGASGTLDSLGVVILLTAVEQGLEDELQATIALADDEAFSSENSPFADVNAFADHILVLLQENAAP